MRAAVILFLLVGLAGPSFAQDAPHRDPLLGREPLGKPDKTLDLAAPAAPSHQYGDKDLREFDAGMLRGAAREARAGGDLPAAVQIQHWAVVADPERGLYDLACYHALAGDAEAALYWLQEAGLSEGLDVGYATRDTDLDAVRADDRWGTLATYLQSCSAYWKRSGHRRELLLLPTGHDPAKPLPALVAFHGLGSAPEDFTADEGDQQLADDLGMAIISVSATECRGRNAWVWSEDVERDLAHVREGLERLSDRVKLEPGFAVATGFSQGGQLALEIAARDPDTFAGAISLCPGFMEGSKLSEIADTSRIPELTVMIVGGSEEGEGNQELRAMDELFFRMQGAATVAHEYRGLGHTFPPNYYDNMQIWTRTVLARRVQAKIAELRTGR